MEKSEAQAVLTNILIDSKTVDKLGNVFKQVFNKSTKAIYSDLKSKPLPKTEDDFTDMVTVKLNELMGMSTAAMALTMKEFTDDVAAKMVEMAGWETPKTTRVDWSSIPDEYKAPVWDLEVNYRAALLANESLHKRLEEMAIEMAMQKVSNKSVLSAFHDVLHKAMGMAKANIIIAKDGYDGKDYNREEHIQALEGFFEFNGQLHDALHAAKEDATVFMMHDLTNGMVKETNGKPQSMVS